MQLRVPPSSVASAAPVKATSLEVPLHELKVQYGAYTLHVLTQVVEVLGKRIPLSQREMLAFYALAEAQRGLLIREFEKAYEVFLHRRCPPKTKPANHMRFMAKRLTEYIDIKGFSAVTTTGSKFSDTFRYHLNQPP